MRIDGYENSNIKNNINNQQMTNLAHSHNDLKNKEETQEGSLSAGASNDGKLRNLGLERIDSYIPSARPRADKNVLQKNGPSGQQKKSFWDGLKEKIKKLWSEEKRKNGEDISEEQIVKQGANMVNPYFVPTMTNEEADRDLSLWQKLKYRVQNMAGSLRKRFSGKQELNTKNEFQTGKEQTKEDLRKHSKYKKEQDEMDCILTDDSYLMDSYDKKGEYRRLSVKE